jgi:Protein of unknown function (DUF3253)
MPYDYTLACSAEEITRPKDIRAVTLELCAARARSSICPSEVARAISCDETAWRALMPSVRNVARQLAKEGLIRVTQKDYEFGLDEEYRGAIRLRLV